MKATDPDGRVANLLVGYYALYQFVHIFVNVRGLYILRYTGPEAAMVNAIPLAEGNASRIP